MVLAVTGGLRAGHRLAVPHGRHLGSGARPRLRRGDRRPGPVPPPSAGGAGPGAGPGDLGARNGTTVHRRRRRAQSPGRADPGSARNRGADRGYQPGVAGRGRRRAAAVRAGLGAAGAGSRSTGRPGARRRPSPRRWPRRPRPRPGPAPNRFRGPASSCRWRPGRCWRWCGRRSWPCSPRWDRADRRNLAGATPAGHPGPPDRGAGRGGRDQALGGGAPRGPGSRAPPAAGPGPRPGRADPPG